MLCVRNGFFRVKRDEHVSRYKARLVAQGQSQVHGVDYFDSFAPVVRFETIRTQSDVEEECYLDVSDGFFLDLKLQLSSGAVLPEDLDSVHSLCPASRLFHVR